MCVCVKQTVSMMLELLVGFSFVLERQFSRHDKKNLLRLHVFIRLALFASFTEEHRKLVILVCLIQHFCCHSAH